MLGIKELVNESTAPRGSCSLCKESLLRVGDKTPYGATVIFRIGSSNENGWFATLSPRTGGNPGEDFTIQLMPFAHLTHFSQIAQYPGLAENFGIAFSRLNEAMASVMASENKELKASAESRETSTSIAVYGKCTNWAEKKEHLHIKVFPFRGSIGQPFTVDSSFERKEIFRDEKTGEGFVKMQPVKKAAIPKQRLELLSKQLIFFLSEGHL